MNFRKYENTIIEELNYSLNAVDSSSCADAINLINNADKVFVLGLGRAGFMAKSLAMRLMHMEKDSFVIGETITPNFENGDLLIITSGSGETKQFLQMAEKAKNFGGKVLAFTGAPHSSITKTADVSVIIPAPGKIKSESTFTSVQPMASLYEQSLLLIFDSIILALIDTSGKNNEEMFKKHSNLE
ncbi:6-phospho-3-hexuloisomerase [Sebaldella sp. S0638]|uniref:6-phospho-3-hexuloisomerase n=1 Tax=Sebaldella sp. S0638 TaxID=2957809 RepID=UPI00209D2FCA|nr:6-phospho-3-hexuloisomerase [Sebaldella sp. S0638]MCP1224233.1 6-phospho-3-hexuloisomerase [Sebaldella sp. S0638]